MLCEASEYDDDVCDNEDDTSEHDNDGDEHTGGTGCNDDTGTGVR